MEKQVGIIGAGISGLLACKYMSEMGFDPIVFEAKASIGGVWTHTLETTKLQNVKDAYQFMDFPWPSSVKQDSPDHDQIMEYIESYAHHFNLFPYIRLNSRVKAINYEGASDEEMESWDLWGGTGDPFSPNGKWNITVEDIHTQATLNYQVEFVILCIGRFSDVPNIPDFSPHKGPEAFDGKVIHSMDYSAMDDAAASEFIRGKRVTVVGIGKSGLDIARECAIANGLQHPCTVLYRTARWSLPNFSPWGVPLPFLYFNRFAEFLMHKPDEGLLLYVLATLLSPLRWLQSTFVESYLRWKLPLEKYNMVPKHSFSNDLFTSSITILPDNFYDLVGEGSIVLKKITTFGFCKDGLMVDDNNAALKTDVVIFATGFKGDEKIRNIFASPTFQKYIIGPSKSTSALYRDCIHPRVPQLAIIGYSVSLANIFSSEIRCKWVGHLLKGTFKLPRVKKMEEDVVRWENYIEKNSLEYCRRSFLGALHIWYNDQLCRDMKCNIRRKSGFFAELFEPYGSMDYVDLFPTDL